MAKSSSLIERYARLGAETRYAELKAEIAEIERAFPGIGGTSAAARRGPRRPRAARIADSGPAAAPVRKRRKMTAAARKAIGDAQRKRWAKQKAQGWKKR